MPTRSPRRTGTSSGTGRQLCIWLPGDVADQVARVADDEALSTSAVVRRAVVRDMRRNHERTKAAS